MKYSGIHSRGDKIFIYSTHELESGAYLDQDDAITVDVSDLKGIGTAVRRQLAAYREGVPMPSREEMTTERPELLHAAAGVRSWEEFVKGAKNLTIRWEHGKITLTPWRRECGRDSFVPIKGRDRVMSGSASDADLGAAVIAALSDAE